MSEEKRGPEFNFSPAQRAEWVRIFREFSAGTTRLAQAMEKEDNMQVTLEFIMVTFLIPEMRRFSEILTTQMKSEANNPKNDDPEYPEFLGGPR